MNVGINGLQQGTQLKSLAPTPSSLQSPSQAQSEFGRVLKASIENMNNLEAISDQKTRELASGDIEDLHEVMIAAQKASITVEATVQVQKKVIDAYNEIMRMQV